MLQRYAECVRHLAIAVTHLVHNNNRPITVVIPMDQTANMNRIMMRLRVIIVKNIIAAMVESSKW